MWRPGDRAGCVLRRNAKGSGGFQQGSQRVGGGNNFTYTSRRLQSVTKTVTDKNSLYTRTKGQDRWLVYLGCLSPPDLLAGPLTAATKRDENRYR